VAAPSIEDPNFARSVVLLLAHEVTEGAMGVILNRPLDAVAGDPTSPLHPWVESAAAPAVLFEGGPVETTGFIVAGPVLQLRVFRGYSGWGPQQLDGELDEGAWMVLPSEHDDVFSPSPDGLWRAVIRRQGGRIAWVANAPDDLSSN